MADPVSLSASVAGIVFLGLTVCSGILQYYGAWKDSGKDSSFLQESLAALTRKFALIERQTTSSIFSREVVDRITESLVACAGAVHKLKEKLEKLKCTKPGAINTQIKRSLYPFHVKTLEKLQKTVDTLRSNLSLAVSALKIEASTMTLEQLTLIDG